MAFKLLDLTNEHLCRPRVGFPTNDFFHPSESSVRWIDKNGIARVSGACLRASYFKQTGQKSLPTDAYTQWIFRLGKHVEEILVEEWKQMGIWVGNNIKFYDKTHNLSGEVDVLLIDPETQELVGAEVKSFYGYNATKELCGNFKQKGHPKTSQLLQALVYVDVCKRYGILDYFKLVYKARDSAKSAEFDVEIVQDGEHLRPMINDEIDYRFTIAEIYDRFEELQVWLDRGQVPPPDYEMRWSPDKVEKMHDLGEVSKTAYEDYCKNPQKNPVGDWMCFAPETLVWMANGNQKKICDMKVGDTVMGLDGPTEVIRVEAKPNRQECLRIRPACMLDTTTTPDHEWLTAEWSSSYNYYSNKPFMLKMKKASDLSIVSDCDYKSCLLIPVVTEDKQVKSLTREHYRLLGYYTAEGNLANQQNGRYYQVWFTIHPDEDLIARDIINCATRLFGCHYQDKVWEDNRHETPRHYRTLKFFSVEFADFIRTRVLGKKAINKTLTASIMHAPIEYVQEFLDTAFAGDGSTGIQRKNTDCKNIATSSRILANQYQQLLWRLGIPARVCYGNRPGEMDGYATHQGYHVEWQSNFHTLKFVTINGFAFACVPIRSIETVDSMPEVWDIEVNSRHHLFATESGLASNCNYCGFKNICWE